MRQVESTLKRGSPVKRKRKIRRARRRCAHVAQYQVHARSSRSRVRIALSEGAANLLLTHRDDLMMI